jgi:hypothetical protein
MSWFKYVSAMGWIKISQLGLTSWREWRTVHALGSMFLGNGNKLNEIEQRKVRSRSEVRGLSVI